MKGHKKKVFKRLKENQNWFRFTINSPEASSQISVKYQGHHHTEVSSQCWWSKWWSEAPAGLLVLQWSVSTSHNIWISWDTITAERSQNTFVVMVLILNLFFLDSLKINWSCGTIIVLLTPAARILSLHPSEFKKNTSAGGKFCSPLTNLKHVRTGGKKHLD